MTKIYDFGRALRHYRHEAGLSQAAICEVLNMNNQNMSHYETGKAMPQLATFCNLCDMLNVSPNTLLGWEAKK